MYHRVLIVADPPKLTRLSVVSIHFDTPAMTRSPSPWSNGTANGACSRPFTEHRAMSFIRRSRNGFWKRTLVKTRSGKTKKEKEKTVFATNPNGKLFFVQKKGADGLTIPSRIVICVTPTKTTKRKARCWRWGTFVGPPGCALLTVRDFWTFELPHPQFC